MSSNVYRFIYFPVIVSFVSYVYYVCSTWILISYERCCSVDSWMVFISCEMLWEVATRGQMPGSFQIFSNDMLPWLDPDSCPKWPGAYMPRSTPSRRTGLHLCLQMHWLTNDWVVPLLTLSINYPSLSNIMSPCNQTWRAGNVTI